MRKLLIATVVGLVVTPSSALAQQPPTQQLNPAQTCRALQETNQAAFAQMFWTGSNAFGKCVSSVARTRAQTPGQPGTRAQTNPARTCRALRAANQAAFAQMFGTGSNAFGKCVSTVAKTRGGGQTP